MNAKVQTIKYLIFDYFSAALSWSLFYFFRKLYIEPEVFGYQIPLVTGRAFFLGLLFIPFLWLFIYYLTGYYASTLRKTRSGDVAQTIFTSVLGVIVIFFAFILDDYIKTYQNYYLSVSVLFIVHGTLTLVPRLFITSQTIHRIRSGKISFNTLIIGSNENAVEVYNDIKELEKETGNHFIGFLNIHNKSHYLLSEHLPHLGNYKQARAIIEKHNVKEVILALEKTEHNELSKILIPIYSLNVHIKAIPDMYDIITGKVKTETLIGTPFISVTHDLMPPWQQSIKKIMDISISMLALIILSPLCIFLIAGIKLSSPGPVIYSHIRIGQFGKPFVLFKFRSMYTNAEKNGPELSRKNDSRMTAFGRFMRRTKLDEIPNFINVLKGEMSLVGPRPERQYFIDRIVNEAPQYIMLHKVKPGITSWGQVKYGYAENVEQMVKRMRYDLIYIQNTSILTDLRILLHTLRTVIKGRGI